jgi:hypothetical protein
VLETSLASDGCPHLAHVEKLSRLAHDLCCPQPDDQTRPHRAGWTTQRACFPPLALITFAVLSSSTTFAPPRSHAATATSTTHTLDVQVKPRQPHKREEEAIAPFMTIPDVHDLLQAVPPSSRFPSKSLAQDIPLPPFTPHWLHPASTPHQASSEGSAPFLC